MYKLLTSAKVADVLFIGFNPDRGRRQQELTNKKNRKRNYHVRNMPRDVLGLAEHQENVHTA